MPDILDDLRTELDSAFERAERAPARARRAPRRFKTVLTPVAAAALVAAAVVAYVPTREGIPADERAVPASPSTIMPAAPPFEPIPAAGVNRYGPVSATMSARWSQQVQLDKGLDAGIHRGDPVIDGAGLVGTVAESARGSSVVTLITDQSFATSVYVGRGRLSGSITPAIGSSGELLFEPVDATAKVRADDLVFTAGTIDPALESRYPRALPIGRVTRIEPVNGDLDRRIYVAPAAELDQLDTVRVLTTPDTKGG